MSAYWLLPRRYRGTRQSRLWRHPFGLSVGGVLTLALALTTGGCAYQLDALGNKVGNDVEHTGSIRSATPPSVAVLPPENDLAVARAAVSDALAKGGKDTSTPWENPQTGARGTITPLSAAYNQDGTTCQDFLASYVREGNESWLQGEACRVRQGRWDVRHLKPWQRR